MSSSGKLNGYRSPDVGGKGEIWPRRNEDTGGHGNYKIKKSDVNPSSASEFASINPFIHRLQLSTIDKIRIAVMTVTLFPLRLLMVGIFLVLTWFFACIAMAGRKKEDEREPMSGWRSRIRPIAVFFARGLFFVGGFHWVTVKGKRASSAEAPILATAPHSSYFDALSVTFLDLTSVVAKTEAENVPFFGTLTKFTQPVFVSREDPDSRHNTIKEIQRRAATGGKWPQIVIFTEGTCTNRTSLITFKQGAFIPGVPVQPVCLKYKNKLDTATWTWNGPGALKLLWLTLCQFDSRLEIEFLPVYVPTEEEKKDVKLFGRNVRKQMAKALDVPTTENSYEDGQAMSNAMSLQLPIAEDLVHLNRIIRQLGISQDDLKKLLEDLCITVQLSPSSHNIMLEDFAKHFKKSSSSEPINELFSFYKEAGCRTVDLRKYVTLINLVCLPRSIDDVLRFSFSVYDDNAKGFLTLKEMNSMLTVLGLPLLVETLFSTSSPQITYDIFRSCAENLPEYENVFCTKEKTERKRKSDRSDLKMKFDRNSNPEEKVKPE